MSLLALLVRRGAQAVPVRREAASPLPAEPRDEAADEAGERESDAESGQEPGA